MYLAECGKQGSGRQLSHHIDRLLRNTAHSTLLCGIIQGTLNHEQQLYTCKSMPTTCAIRCLRDTWTNMRTDHMRHSNHKSRGEADHRQFRVPVSRRRAALVSRHAAEDKCRRRMGARGKADPTWILRQAAHRRRHGGHHRGATASSASSKAEVWLDPPIGELAGVRHVLAAVIPGHGCSGPEVHGRSSGERREMYLAECGKQGSGRQLSHHIDRLLRNTAHSTLLCGIIQGTLNHEQQLYTCKSMPTTCAIRCLRDTWTNMRTDHMRHSNHKSRGEADHRQFRVPVSRRRAALVSRSATTKEHHRGDTRCKQTPICKKKAPIIRHPSVNSILAAKHPCSLHQLTSATTHAN